MRLCHLPSSKVLSLCLLFYGTRLGKPLNKVIEGAFGFKACKAVAFCKDLEPEALARALSPRVATAGASSDCRLSASVQGPSPAVLQQACSADSDVHGDACDTGQALERPPHTFQDTTLQ